MKIRRGFLGRTVVLMVILALFLPMAALAQEASGSFLVDDFNAGQRNRLGGRASNFERAPSRCAFSLVSDEKYGAVGKSLRLQYTKAGTGGPYGQGGWCGYYTILATDNQYFDASSYNAVTFYVKGAVPGATFAIGIADRTWQEKGDSIKSGPVDLYLPGGVTTEWQKVVIPLEDYGGIDMTELASIAVVFTQPGEGTIYIDDLQFEILPEAQLVILPYPADATSWLFADFEEGLTNALGGRIAAYQRAPSSAEVKVVPDGYEGQTMIVEYTRAGEGGPYGQGGWCGAYIILKRGNTFTDLLPFNAVRFWVRGEMGGENFEIGMADEYWSSIEDSVKAGSVDYYLGGPLTTEWTQVTIPFDDFGFLDWEKMGSMSINFTEPGSGAIYIDQIEFVNTEAD